MSLNKEINSDEKKKIMDLYHSLEKTVEQNTQNIVSYKSKLETINEGINVHKKMAKRYEKKLEELVTEIVNVEWNQIKAKTVRKADAQFIENKGKGCDEYDKPNKILEDETVQIDKLKDEKNKLEVECKRNNKMIEELITEYQKLKEECELYQKSDNN